MGRKPTSGGVRPAGERIQIRFVWQGKQVGPTLPLKPTASNLKHAARLRESILQDIRLGTFEFQKYFPDYQNLPAAPDAAPERTFSQWVAVWEELSARDMEHSTLSVYKRHMKAYWLPAFGDMLPQKISHEAVLKRLSFLAADRFDEELGKNVKGLGRKTQNNIMIPLRGVFDLICRPPRSITDPTEGVRNLKTQKGKPDPFAPQEVELILAAIGKRRGEEMHDYFEFSFFAGLRASEQIALRWEDVDLRSMSIVVTRARVMSQDKDRTKTNVERHVELNARAAGVIQRQRARTQARGDVVFYNPITDKPYADEQAQRLAWTTCLRGIGIRYRPPKECRDTSVTMALMAGANPVWVAAQHGHSVTVMMRDYAKWIPSADRGSNLAAVNRSITAPSDLTRAI